MRTLSRPLPLVSADPAALTFDKIRTAPPGGNYVFEHLLTDTIQYPAAGAAGLALPIFGQTGRGADATLSNWPVNGALPIAHKFHGLYLFATPLVETAMAAAVGAAGPVQDWEKITRTARAVIDFDIVATGRRRPPIALAAIPSLPGARSVIVPGTAAAQNPIQSIQQVGQGDGYPFDLPLAGGEGFSLILRCRPDIAVPIAANMNIQFAVYGWYYQPAG